MFSRKLQLNAAPSLSPPNHHFVANLVVEQILRRYALPGWSRCATDLPAVVRARVRLLDKCVELVLQWGLTVQLLYLPTSGAKPLPYKLLDFE